jgi:hypothetical protein
MSIGDLFRFTALMRVRKFHFRHSIYWNCLTWGGSRFALPTLRGQDYEIPYRAGQMWRTKYQNSRTVTLQMFTAGISQVTGAPATPSASVTDAQRLAVNNNFQQLRQMFFQRGPAGSAQSTLVRRWYITQSGTPQIVKAQALCEIAGSMEPTANHRASLSFAVDLLLSDPYFYASTATQAITTAGGTITNPAEGVAGESYPSSLNAFTLSLTAGPCTITNTTAGVSVTYGAAITNSPVTLDILNSTATDNAGNNVIANVTHSGARPWMVLLTGANAITVSDGTVTFNYNPPYI